MMNDNSSENALNKFVRAIRDSVIEPLKKNQASLAYQQELRDSKRFKDTESKLMQYSDRYRKLFETTTVREKMLNVLHGIRARRGAQFNERHNAMAPEDQEAFNAALAPYLSLLQPADEIRKLQTALVSQGKLKNMRFASVEIMATLGEVGGLVANMGKMLVDSLLKTLAPA